MKLVTLNQNKQTNQKNHIYFYFIAYAKVFDCVAHKKLWNILREMGIPDHLICLLRNLHSGQETAVRTDMEQQTGSKLENAGLDDSQAGIKIAEKNINNLRYAYDTTLIAKSEEELKSILRKVKGE